MSTAEERAAMRAQARKDYPNLTLFDTGEALQPKPWPVSSMQDDDDWGKVDFDNDEKATELTLSIGPSKTVDRMLDLDIEKGSYDGLMIYVNGELVATIPPEKEF